jgi:hypothetical protein
MPSPEDCAKLQAFFEGVEDARREVEAKWGVGRVELLADDTLRARWRGQCVRWSAAYAAAWDAPYLTIAGLQSVADLSAAMRRGYAALDAAAEEAGHRGILPWVWEVALADGSVAALVQTDAEASKVIAEGRFLAVYTLAEIANVLAALPDALRRAKEVFPGARFQAPRRMPDGEPWRPEVGEEIPFPFSRELEPSPETSNLGDSEWA